MSHAELIAELRRRPEDEQVWSVLGDLLAEAGDAHGELIALEQRAAASEPGFVRAELEHRARILFEDQRRTWLGELADAGLELTWLRGFITRATVARQHRRLIIALLELPVAALLRELVVLRPPSIRTVLAELASTRLERFELHAREPVELDAFAVLDAVRELHVANSSTLGVEHLAALDELEDLELHNFSGALDGFATTRWPGLKRLGLTARANAHALGPDALEPLAGLAELTELDLREGGWTDIGPLAGLCALEALDLRSTDILSLEPLTGLTRLRRLALGGCAALANIEALAGLADLSRLELRYTRVQDLRPLAGLERLEVLDLSGTPVRHLDPLFELPALQRVVVEACDIEDAGPLFERGVKVIGVRPPEPSWRELADRLINPR